MRTNRQTDRQTLRLIELLSQLKGYTRQHLTFLEYFSVPIKKFWGGNLEQAGAEMGQTQPLLGLMICDIDQIFKNLG